MAATNAPPAPRGWRLAAFGVGVVAAARCSLLFIDRARGVPGAGSFKIEAAATVLAAAAAVAVLLVPAERNPPTDLASDEPSWIWWPVFVSGALVLYWPTLFIGFLSDDFVLMPRAEHWQLGAATPYLFRPVTLAVWAVLRTLGIGPAGFHALNIALHGTAAFLTCRLASGWLGHQSRGLAAGALFLVFPIAVEAVAWVSGGFDLLATTLVLGLVVIGRRYARGPAVATRLLFGAVGLAALFSKEIGVVAGALVLLDAWVRRALRRELIVDAVALTSVAVAFGILRASAAPDFDGFHITKYIAQRALFQSLGGLAQQWPAAAPGLLPWPAIVQALGTISLVLLFAWTSSRDRLRLPAAAGAWILVSVAPVFTWILISEYLEGSRYLYLAAPAWAVVLVALAASASGRWMRTFAWLVIGLAIGGGAWAARVQMSGWSEAAGLRDAVLDGVRTLDTAQSCPAIAVSRVPDSIRGAYVFRNGLPQALAMAGLPPLATDAAEGCRFHWDPARGAIVAD